MTEQTSLLLDIDDIDKEFLPNGRFDPKDETHFQLIIDKFRKDGGKDGFFTDVYFDGLVVQINPNQEAQEELEECIELLQLGGYKPAIHRIKPLLKKYPYNIHLLYNYGMALREIGEVQESIEILNRAVTITPDHVHAWVALCVSFQTVGDNENALHAINKAHDLDDADPYVLRSLGYLLEASGDPVEAISYLEKALEIHPDDAQSHLILGKIKLKSNPIQAKKHFQNVCESAPGTALSQIATNILEDL